MELAPRPQRATLAGALAQAHPESGRAWAAWVGTLPPRAPERAEALALAERHQADEAPDVLTQVALACIERGQLDAAQGAAGRAVVLAPWSGPALEAAARVARARGDCPGAVALQGRAVAQLAEQPSEALRRRVTATLQAYRACAAP